MKEQVPGIFASEEDNDWLDEVNENFGLDQLVTRYEFNEASYDSPSMEQQAHMTILLKFFMGYYSDVDSHMLVDLDSEALKLIQNVAEFKRCGLLVEGNECTPVGERFPEITAGSVQFSLRYQIRQARIKLECAKPGGYRSSLQNLEFSDSILARVADKAVEIEATQSDTG